MDGFNPITIKTPIATVTVAKYTGELNRAHIPYLLERALGRRSETLNTTIEVSDGTNTFICTPRNSFGGADYTIKRK